MFAPSMTYRDPGWLTAAAGTNEGMAEDEAELRDEAETCLRALAGEHARLREDQWTAIRALVAERRRALVVQRTGWGKSAVYFIATALLRARGAGPTVIVSPLLALMRNQVEAAKGAGIRARTINSANTTEWEALYAEVAAGQADVLLVSPERLNNPSFRDQVLPELSRSAGLVVIDEAHCISDWGHDFRPDYRRLRTLLDDLPAGIPVLATTATANARVTADVAEQLGTGGARRDAGAARAAGPGLAAAGRGHAAHRAPAARLAGGPARRAARVRHRLRADGRGGAGDRGLPARAGADGGVLHRPGRAGGAGPGRGGPARQPGQGAGRHQRARHGLRQAGPRLRRAPGRAAVAGRLLPADRPGRAGP